MAGRPLLEVRREIARRCQPPAEQRVARLVLADARSFASLPVGELAARAQVSKPTVVRFCRSVGYDGLSDFKLKLAGAVNEGVRFVHRAVDEDDKPGDIVVKVIDNAVSALLKYRNEAASPAIERAIAALAAACRNGRRIEFYGVGNSGIVAQDAQHKFFRFNLAVSAHSDVLMQRMLASVAHTGDLFVIISYTGRTRELVEVARSAPLIRSCAHFRSIMPAKDSREPRHRSSSSTTSRV